MEEEGAEHISTQDVEDAQLRATLAATHVDELRAQVVDRSRRQRAKRPRDVVGGAEKTKGTSLYTITRRWTLQPLVIDIKAWHPLPLPTAYIPCEALHF